jgi:hypothetical protein
VLCGSIRHDRPASLRQTRTSCRPSPRPARRGTGPLVATRGQPPVNVRHPASLRPWCSSSRPTNPVLAVLAPVGQSVRLALAITIQGIWLSNPHSAAVMSRGFVQCASFRQPQSPARRAGGRQNDGRGLGLAERTLSFGRNNCTQQNRQFPGNIAQIIELRCLSRRKSGSLACFSARLGLLPLTARLPKGPPSERRYR